MLQYPNVSETVSNEENIQQMRSWGYGLVDELRTIIMQMQEEINAMREEKGEE